MREGTMSGLAMSEAELMFFGGAPFAHVVAYREYQRLARKRRQNLDGLRRVASHSGRGQHVQLMERAGWHREQAIDPAYDLVIVPPAR
jgi:hypothetical protein